MTIDQWAQHCVLSLSKENYDEVLNSIDDVLPLLENDLILRPKFHAWWAQAFLSKQDPNAAIRHVNTAIRYAKQIQDDDGVIALKEFRSTAISMLAAINAKSHGTPTILEQAIRKIDSGEIVIGEQLAEQSYQQAIAENNNKMEILSLLAMAKIQSRRIEVLALAHDRAQDIGDPNLITAVKKTMDSLGCVPPPHIF
jgi:hypothetical protein